MAKKAEKTKSAIIYVLLVVLGFTLMVIGIKMDDDKGVLKLIFSIPLITLGSAICFTIAIGFITDKLKKDSYKEDIRDVLNEFTDSYKKNVCHIIKEFTETGICDFFKRRDDNDAERKIFNEFKSHYDGEIKLIGVTLKNFLHNSESIKVDGTILYEKLKEQLNNKNFKIKVLICDPDKNPEVKNRSPVRTKRRIQETIKDIIDLNSNNFNNINCNTYIEAPYYTAIIFPQKCYVVPNMLNRNDSTNPFSFVSFCKNSTCYKQINQAFDDIWGKPFKKII